MKVTFEDGTLKGVLDQMTAFFEGWVVKGTVVSVGEYPLMKGEYPKAEPKKTHPPLFPKAEPKKKKTRGKAKPKLDTQISTLIKTTHQILSEKPKKGSRRKLVNDLVGKPPPLKLVDVSDDMIEDRDVSKAASDAAMVLTTTVVTKVMDEFGVSHVGDLDQGQRREFIDKLEELKANE